MIEEPPKTKYPMRFVINPKLSFVINFLAPERLSIR